MSKLIVGPKTKITVNGTDISDHVSSINVSDNKDEVEVTGMGETYREFLPGLGDGNIDMTLFQDYASSQVDSILYPLYLNNTAGTVKVTPDTSGTIVYTSIAKLYGYPPIAGGVGDANTIDISWRNAGTAGLTRGTS